MPVLDTDYRAVVIGASGGIGAALLDGLRNDPRCGEAIGFSRASSPAVDLQDEPTIAAAAHKVAEAGPVHLVINAAGLLHADSIKPEKALKDIDPETLARLFAVNTTGPLLVLKHFVPLLPKDEASVVAALVARVGSIGDNALGGWYAYRASKAALAMAIRTTAIELARTRPKALCIGLHPGTVDTGLSAPFGGAKKGVPPAQAAANLLQVISDAGPDAHGRQLAYDGSVIEP